MPAEVIWLAMEGECCLVEGMTTSPTVPGRSVVGQHNVCSCDTSARVGSCLSWGPIGVFMLLQQGIEGQPGMW
jgi:hypothetical protein